MKNLVLIMAVMTVVYGLDTERVENFKKDYEECNKDLGHEKLTLCIDSFKCALQKDGQIFSEDGFSLDEFFKFMEDVIPDACELGRARQLFKDYYKKERRSKVLESSVMETLHSFFLRILALILIF